MKTNKRTSNSLNSNKKDPNQQEKSQLQKIQALCGQIEELGFTIRKEKLKQGFGWKCNSGSCLFKGRPVLFLDSKLSIDEQVDFLSSFLANFNSNSLKETQQSQVAL